jgi:hypothetical protein
MYQRLVFTQNAPADLINVTYRPTFPKGTKSADQRIELIKAIAAAIAAVQAYAISLCAFESSAHIKIAVTSIDDANRLPEAFGCFTKQAKTDPFFTPDVDASLQAALDRALAERARGRHASALLLLLQLFKAERERPAFTLISGERSTPVTAKDVPFAQPTIAEMLQETTELLQRSWQTAQATESLVFTDEPWLQLPAINTLMIAYTGRGDFRRIHELFLHLYGLWIINEEMLSDRPDYCQFLVLLAALNAFQTDKELVERQLVEDVLTALEACIPTASAPARAFAQSVFTFVAQQGINELFRQRFEALIGQLK